MRRRWVLLTVGGVAAIAVAVALALFQPWKLWVDDRVDQAAPAGAVPIAAVTTTSVPAAVTTSTSTTTTTIPPGTVAPTTTTLATTTLAPTMPVGGEFVAIDHSTTGAALLLQDPSGAVFVRLEALDTSNGPDLFVYLSSNPPDGPEGAFDDDYLDLGRLQGNVGSSNYAVPAGTDLSRYASVVIWCDRFDSAFGAAPLS